MILVTQYKESQLKFSAPGAPPTLAPRKKTIFMLNFIQKCMFILVFSYSVAPSKLYHKRFVFADGYGSGTEPSPIPVAARSEA
jgi:hypothetical protein